MTTITQVLSALPTAPARTQTPTAFVASADAFIGGFALLQTQQNTLTGQINTVSGEVASNAAATALNAGVAATAQAVVTAQSPVTNAAAAAASAAQAGIYASQAQTTNPDTPIRTNLRSITADFTVGSNYNAMSIGPNTIAQGVTVTVSDNATYAIN